MSKTVVVTGASTGIGFATSVAPAKAGYDVFAGVRSEAAGGPLRKGSASTRGKITPDARYPLRINDEFTIDVMPSIAGHPWAEMQQHIESIDTSGWHRRTRP